jgi:hypothetical protein
MEGEKMPGKSGGGRTGGGKTDGGGGTSARSAITGRYVTKATAQRHPKTTVEEKRN